MTIYVALLRGVNLAGRAKVGMQDLRRLFEALGHTEVKTYVQSGNVIFSGTDTEPSRLARQIESRLAEDLGLTTTVLLRTGDELDQVAARNPYLGRESDFGKLHVTFLAEVPDEDRAAGLERPAGEPAEFSVAGREVYLLCPAGYGRTKLNNAFLEKRLGVAGTTRNWRTVTKLRELTSG